MNNLPKKERLTNYSQILTLRKSKCSYCGKYIDFKYIFVDSDEPFNCKILISVSKRLFKRAVDRNLLKRRIREAYRTNKKFIVKIIGKVILVNFIYKSADICDYKSIENDVKLFMNNFDNS